MYAITYVYAPTQRPTAILFGTQHPRRLWLNGKLVHQSSEARPWHWVTDWVPVVLQPGCNTILVKISFPGKPESFTLRLNDSPLDRAFRLAERGLWDESAEMFLRGARDLPLPDGHITHCAALIDLYRNNVTRYREGYDRYQERFGWNPDDPNVFWVAQMRSVGGHSSTNPASLVPIAQEGRKLPVLTKPYTDFFVALAQYRAEMFEDSLATVQGIGSDSWARDWLLEAMDEHRLGRPERARTRLQDADMWFNSILEGMLAEPLSSLRSTWLRQRLPRCAARSRRASPTCAVSMPTEILTPCATAPISKNSGRSRGIPG